MSLLGSDALGRLALGQLPPLQTAALPALSGSYAVSGPTTNMSTAQSAVAASFGLGGRAAAFASWFSLLSVSYRATGNAAAFGIPLSPITGSFASICNAGSFATAYVVSGTNYAIAAPVSTLGVATTANCGNWNVSGAEAAFARGYEAWFPLPSHGASWVGGRVPESGWTSGVAPAGDWSIAVEGKDSWTKVQDPPGSWVKN
ncbi:MULTISPECIES: hypothetical protein [unclassified Bradyrhizobium]|uniref:hypothetical protein n=1 Tax=unclassified Bradyrhizobium TaxID=2631580 RepID=UPI0028F05459|nr:MULTISPECIES: hypothetical protein [unclassified Bradyrhizobium]